MYMTAYAHTHTRTHTQRAHTYTHNTHTHNTHTHNTHTHNMHAYTHTHTHITHTNTEDTGVLQPRGPIPTKIMYGILNLWNLC